MSMFEVWTKALVVDDAALVIDSLAKRSDFSQTGIAEGVHTFVGRDLPDLCRYVVGGVTGIGIRIHHAFSTDDAVRWLRELSGLYSSGTGITWEMKGRTDDVRPISVRAGMTWMGGKLAVRHNSAGRSGRHLFAPAVVALCRMCGIENELGVVAGDNGTNVRISGEKIVPYSSEMRTDKDGVTRAFGRGCRIVELNRDDGIHGLAEREDVIEVAVYVPTFEEVCRILEASGGVEAKFGDWCTNVSESDVNLSVKPEFYAEVRLRTPQVVKGPYEVMFYGTAPYRFTDLRAAAAETGSAILHGAWIKPKGVGEAAISAYWEDGTVKFQFAMERERPKAATVLADLLKGIVGRDIVDWGALQ